MKWSLKDPIVLILIFFIVRVTVLMWNSPFYTTPTEKTLNIIKGVGVGIACLGSAYLFSYKRGRELRGEGPFDTVHEHDWLIFFGYLVWIILWELLDLTDKSAHPSLHYFGILVGIIIITFVWFEMGVRARIILVM